MAKYKNNLTTKLVDTVTDGAQKAKNAVNTIANNNVVRGIVNNISPFRTDSGLRGVSTETQGNVDKYSAEYKPSEQVTAALDKKNQASNAVTNYGPYQSSYQAQLDDIYNKIMNREDFTYDMNSDVLYNQYKDQYQALGQTAMADTMAQASALTGGYGNSYASTVGNQAYQAYLSQLNDKVPELYQLAQNNYNMQTQNLYDQYALTQSADQTAYGRYLDEYNKLVGDRDYYTGDYYNQYNMDYGQHMDNRNYWQNQAIAENADYWQNKNFNYNVLSDAVNFGYGMYRDTVSDAWNAANFGYGIYRDSVSDAQWKKQFDYNASRDAVADAQWRETFDYGKQRDEVADSQWRETFDYNAGRDAVADAQWRETFDYNKYRDNVADSQWQKTFDYNAGRDKVADSQWDKEYQLKKANTVSVPSGGSGGSSDKKGANGAKPAAKPKKDPIDAGFVYQAKGSYTGINKDKVNKLTWASSNNELADMLDRWVDAGEITEAEADECYALYKKDLTTFNDVTSMMKKNGFMK